jgi:hypothetical protein
MDSFRPLLRFATDQPWSIPVIGLLVASLAFLLGRRWFVSRPSSVVSSPAVQEGRTKLITALGPKSAEIDRRSTPRRKGNRVEVFVTEEGAEAPILGWVIVEHPLAEGTVLSVRPRQAPQMAPWIAVEVRSCRAEALQWEIGCRFVQTPHWNDLLLFG